MKQNGYKAVIPIVSGIAYIPNPKPYKDLPLAVALRSERIDESRVVPLAPGVSLITQISRTGKRVPVTHGEQRLFLWLQDDQGRSSLFYQSFAGTGGKEQGIWFPSGGVAADAHDRGVWIIKGNPKTDPGAGRVPLLEFYERVNAVLPHSDQDTDAFLTRMVGMDYEDFAFKDEFEIQPTIKITESGFANALQNKWSNWIYQFWALNALDKTFGKRTFNMKSNPVDLEGRFVPERYLAGLPPALQKQRLRELTQSRDAYKSGDYSELPTDRTARKMGLVKQSAYTTVAKKRGIEWRGDAGDMAARILQYYGARPSQRDVTEFAEALKKVFSKGLAAWKSGGHRPGATAQNWAVARVNSVAVGGKAAWTADKKEFSVLPQPVRKKIVAALPELYKALTSQSRQKDVASIQSKAKANPVFDPQLREIVGKKLAFSLQGQLKRYAKKMLDKYGKRAAGEEVIEDAVQGAQTAIADYVISRYTDDQIRDLIDIDEDLGPLRGTALNIGKKAVGRLTVQSQSLMSEPHLRFWERVDAARKFLTRPGGNPPPDKQVAEHLGLDLDLFNRAKFEHRVLQESSYDRLLGLGIERDRRAPQDLTEEIGTRAVGRDIGQLIEGAPSGTGAGSGDEFESEVEPGAMEFIQETFTSPELQTYLNQIGAPVGYEEALQFEVLKEVLAQLTQSERILLDTYVAGGSSAGMTERKFELKLFGGYDPAVKARVPGLTDRMKNKFVQIVQTVAGLPDEVKAAIAKEQLSIGQAIASLPPGFAPKQLTGTSRQQRLVTRRRLPAILGE